MNILFRRILFGFLLLVTLIGSVGAQDLPQFEVVLNSTADEVRGIVEVWSSIDPSKFTGLILLIKVNKFEGDRIWSNDFSIGYTRFGLEEVQKCLGLGLVTDEKITIHSEGLWLFGDYIDLVVTEGSYFQVLFGIEADVDEVTLFYKQPVVRAIKINQLHGETY